ncbi:hypothetical protein Pint_02268 [Pistacia integerrima]|uniref:Uncharacterized protein n=1 Tax=Pistacia integerrima TaxID=434235 RepID=A0ACC0ZQH5_9ROSI|nr:hypothetical protein Pint_02268 [Pistacia integerrima]
MNYKKNSLAVYLTGQLLEILKKVRGPEAAASYIHGTITNSSVGITKVMGPIEKMTLANRPVKGLYFTVAGAPQSLGVALLSYMGNLRVALGAERGFIDAQKVEELHRECISDDIQSCM